MVFTGLIPFSYLSVTNLMIYKKLRMNKMSKVRRNSTVIKSAGNLAAVQVIVGKGLFKINVNQQFHLVLVFLISNTPRLVLNLSELNTQNGNDGLKC